MTQKYFYKTFNTYDGRESLILIKAENKAEADKERQRLNDIRRKNGDTEIITRFLK